MTKRNNTQSVTIGDKNRFHGDAAIGQNAQIIKNHIVQDNSKHYEIEKKDVTITHNTSKFFITKYGEKTTGLLGMVTIIAGLIEIFTWANSLSLGKQLFSWLPVPSGAAAPWLLGTGLGIFIIGAFLVAMVAYYRFSRCERCNQDWAYEESGDAHVREIDVHDGTRRTISREYTCKHCGHKTIRKEHEHIEKDNAS